MVTSPLYNVGKEYDENLNLEEYFDLLTDVFAETHRVLVNGGRACVNIAKGTADVWRVKQKKFNYLLTQYSDILGWSSKRE